MLSKIVSFFCVLSLTSMSLGGPLSEVSQKKIARIDQLNSNIETQKNNVVDAVVLQIMQINNRSQVLQANDLVTSMNKTVEQIRNLETNAASTINEVRSQYNEIKGSPSMTGAVRKSVRMFLLRNVLTKGTPNAPKSARTYHWFARL